MRRHPWPKCIILLAVFLLWRLRGCQHAAASPSQTWTFRHRFFDGLSQPSSRNLFDLGLHQIETASLRRRRQGLESESEMVRGSEDPMKCVKRFQPRCVSEFISEPSEDFSDSGDQNASTFSAAGTKSGFEKVNSDAEKKFPPEETPKEQQNNDIRAQENNRGRRWNRQMKPSEKCFKDDYESDLPTDTDAHQHSKLAFRKKKSSFDKRNVRKSVDEGVTSAKRLLNEVEQNLPSRSANLEIMTNGATSTERTATLATPNAIPSSIREFEVHPERSDMSDCTEDPFETRGFFDRINRADKAVKRTSTKETRKVQVEDRMAKHDASREWFEDSRRKQDMTNLNGREECPLRGYDVDSEDSHVTATSEPRQQDAEDLFFETTLLLPKRKSFHKNKAKNLLFKHKRKRKKFKAQRIPVDPMSFDSPAHCDETGEEAEAKEILNDQKECLQYEESLKQLKTKERNLFDSETQEEEEAEQTTKRRKMEVLKKRNKSQHKKNLVTEESRDDETSVSAGEDRKNRCLSDSANASDRNDDSHSEVLASNRHLKKLNWSTVRTGNRDGYKMCSNFNAKIPTKYFIDMQGIKHRRRRNDRKEGIPGTHVVSVNQKSDEPAAPTTKVALTERRIRKPRRLIPPSPFSYDKSKADSESVSFAEESHLLPTFEQCVHACTTSGFFDSFPTSVFAYGEAPELRVPRFVKVHPRGSDELYPHFAYTSCSNQIFHRRPFQSPPSFDDIVWNSKYPYDSLPLEFSELASMPKALFYLPKNEYDTYNSELNRAQGEQPTVVSWSRDYQPLLPEKRPSVLSPATPEIHFQKGRNDVPSVPNDLYVAYVGTTPKCDCDKVMSLVTKKSVSPMKDNVLPVTSEIATDDLGKHSQNENGTVSPLGSPQDISQRYANYQRFMRGLFEIFRDELSRQPSRPKRTSTSHKNSKPRSKRHVEFSDSIMRKIFNSWDEADLIEQLGPEYFPPPPQADIPRSSRVHRIKRSSKGFVRDSSLFDFRRGVQKPLKEILQSIHRVNQVPYKWKRSREYKRHKTPFCFEDIQSSSKAEVPRSLSEAEGRKQQRWGVRNNALDQSRTFRTSFSASSPQNARVGLGRIRTEKQGTRDVRIPVRSSPIAEKGGFQEILDQEEDDDADSYDDDSSYVSPFKGLRSKNVNNGLPKRVSQMGAPPLFQEAQDIATCPQDRRKNSESQWEMESDAEKQERNANLSDVEAILLSSDQDAKKESYFLVPASKPKTGRRFTSTSPGIKGILGPSKSNGRKQLDLTDETRNADDSEVSFTPDDEDSDNTEFTSSDDARQDLSDDEVLDMPPVSYILKDATGEYKAISLKLPELDPYLHKLWIILQRIFQKRLFADNVISATDKSLHQKRLHFQENRGRWSRDTMPYLQSQNKLGMSSHDAPSPKKRVPRSVLSNEILTLNQESAPNLLYTSRASCSNGKQMVKRNLPSQFEYEVSLGRQHESPSNLREIVDSLTPYESDSCPSNGGNQRNRMGNLMDENRLEYAREIHNLAPPADAVDYHSQPFHRVVDVPIDRRRMLQENQQLSRHPVPAAPEDDAANPLAFASEYRNSHNGGSNNAQIVQSHTLRENSRLLEEPSSSDWSFEDFRSPIDVDSQENLDSSLDPPVSSVSVTWEAEPERNSNRPLLAENRGIARNLVDLKEELLPVNSDASSKQLKQRLDDTYRVRSLMRKLQKAALEAKGTRRDVLIRLIAMVAEYSAIERLHEIQVYKHKLYAIVLGNLIGGVLIMVLISMFCVWSKLWRRLSKSDESISKCDKLRHFTSGSASSMSSSLSSAGADTEKQDKMRQQKLRNANQNETLLMGIDRGRNGQKMNSGFESRNLQPSSNWGPNTVQLMDPHCRGSVADSAKPLSSSLQRMPFRDNPTSFRTILAKPLQQQVSQIHNSGDHSHRGRRICFDDGFEGGPIPTPFDEDKQMLYQNRTCSPYLKYGTCQLPPGQEAALIHPVDLALPRVSTLPAPSNASSRHQAPLPSALASGKRDHECSSEYDTTSCALDGMKKRVRFADQPNFQPKGKSFNEHMSGDKITTIASGVQQKAPACMIQPAPQRTSGTGMNFQAYGSNQAEGFINKDGVQSGLRSFESAATLVDSTTRLAFPPPIFGDQVGSSPEFGETEFRANSCRQNELFGKPSSTSANLSSDNTFLKNIPLEEGAESVKEKESAIDDWMPPKLITKSDIFRRRNSELDISIKPGASDELFGGPKFIPLSEDEMDKQGVKVVLQPRKFQGDEPNTGPGLQLFANGNGKNRGGLRSPYNLNAWMTQLDSVLHHRQRNKDNHQTRIPTEASCAHVHPQNQSSGIPEGAQFLNQNQDQLTLIEANRQAFSDNITEARWPQCSSTTFQNPVQISDAAAKSKQAANPRSEDSTSNEYYSSDSRNSTESACAKDPDSFLPHDQLELAPNPASTVPKTSENRAAPKSVNSTENHNAIQRELQWLLKVKEHANAAPNMSRSKRRPPEQKY